MVWWSRWSELGGAAQDVVDVVWWLELGGAARDVVDVVCGRRGSLDGSVSSLEGSSRLARQLGWFA